MNEAPRWLLLLYGLPANRNSTRVNLWRNLKKAGALPFKTSVSLLPDRPEQYERLQWIAQQVRDGGGEATIIRVTGIEGFEDRQIIAMFNEARTVEYDALCKDLTALMARAGKRPDEEFLGALPGFLQRFEEIRKLDFFDCPRAQEAQMLLQKAERLRSPAGKKPALLSAKKYQGRLWLTRPRPQIDRVASAWLIRRFIDPAARFVFASEPALHPDAIPFDMYGVEFTHHGDDCTFETLVRRFGIRDKAVLKLAEMVHDADLEDGKFKTAECLGIQAVLKGWAKAGLTDEELLEQGAKCFEGLYCANR